MIDYLFGSNLPSKKFYDYGKSKKWDASVLTLKDIDPMNEKSGRPIEPLPQKILEDCCFIGLSYHPVDRNQRLTDAYWDCLGEKTFRPSGEILTTIYCSRTKPLNKEDHKSIDLLEKILKFEKASPGLYKFPHNLFDRWDMMIHMPNTFYEGNEQPEYAGRFILDSGKVKNVGFYGCEAHTRMDGWGFPDIDTLLGSTSSGEGSFYSNESLDYYEKSLNIKNKPSKNINRMLGCFNEITKEFYKGTFNHVHSEQFDFGDSTDAAIGVGEALTGKRSKLRFYTFFSKLFGKN